MGILEQEMKRLAQQAGGSHKTVHDRIKLAQRFCERLVLAQNVQIRRVEQRYGMCQTNPASGYSAAHSAPACRARPVAPPPSRFAGNAS